jgi:transposase-like protein
MLLSKELLKDLYHEQKLSMAQIARQLGCSTNKVAYWMTKYGLARRDIREAIYQWHNPDGDPFHVKTIKTERRTPTVLSGAGSVYWRRPETRT